MAKLGTHLVQLGALLQGGGPLPPETSRTSSSESYAEPRESLTAGPPAGPQAGRTREPLVEYRPEAVLALQVPNSGTAGAVAGMIPTTGIALFQLLPPDPEETLTEIDVAMGRAILAEHLEPVSDMTWDIVRERVRREGWTRSYFKLVVDKLLEKTWVTRGDSHPRWYLGEWWRPYGPRLYGRDWYEALTPAQQQHVELYDVPGHGVLYAPAGTNAPFDRWDGRKRIAELVEHEQKLLGAMPAKLLPEMAGEVREELDLLKRVLKLTADLEREEGIRTGLETANRKLRAEVEELRRQRDNLAEWNMDLVAALEHWAAAERSAAAHQIDDARRERDELLADLKPDPVPDAGDPETNAS